MLWLALAFPLLPLEAQSERITASAAGAVVVERGRVLVVDEVAAAAGLMPGMRLSTARGILPEACIIERDANLMAREQQVLNDFACYSGGVTPTVSVQPPSTLLLEIGGCLRLFGGVGPILEQLLAASDERGLTVVAGAAPSPRAAEWLALAQTGQLSRQPPAARLARAKQHCCLTREALPGMLASLPLAVLTANAEMRARLHGFGLRRVGEIVALPRAALAQRIGPELVTRLQQALDEIPDPRIPYRFPERFRHRIELSGTVEDAAMLAFPARRLIGDLCGWLAARQCGAVACTLTLLAERRGVPPVVVSLALAGASRDPLRFERLLRERLARTRLVAPVGELVLEAGMADGGGDVVELPGQPVGLFEKRLPETSLDALVERLRARFGDAAVHGLVTVPDHRPECATRMAPIGMVSPDPVAAPVRPLWLLQEPEALAEKSGRPTRHGEVFELVSGPERIESGWWDEGEMRGEVQEKPGSEAAAGGGGRAPGDVRRDYFIARLPRGEWWWIYRDARGWWGQGIAPLLTCS